MSTKTLKFHLEITEKIPFEVGKLPQKLRKNWEKYWNENNFFDILLVSHVYNHHDSKRISSDPYHSPIIF